ncbi:MAG TPA: hypothetical protein PKD42_16460, partial [Chitinophagaceae bacterium]|nr:hypothetical protein [Chitinophagaceae bacterium]
LKARQFYVMASMHDFNSNGKWYRIRIERIYESNQVIRYKVSGRNKYLIFQNNEPFFRNRGLMHRRPNWKMIEGQMMDLGFITRLTRYLDEMQKQKKI